MPTPGRTVDVDPVVGQLYVAGEGSIYVLDGASGALREQRSFEGRPGRLAVNRTTGAVYLGHRWTGRVVAYRFDRLPLLSDREGMAVEFAEVGGLTSGDDVIVSGLKVGEVTRASIDGGHVLVEFDLMDRDVTLGSQTEANRKMLAAFR